MINAHLASKAHSARSETIVSRPGIATFWIFFATISLVLVVMISIAISSIPSQVPLSRRDHVWQVRDMAHDSLPPHNLLRARSADIR